MRLSPPARELRAPATAPRRRHEGRAAEAPDEGGLATACGGRVDGCGALLQQGVDKAFIGEVMTGCF